MEIWGKKKISEAVGAQMSLLQRSRQAGKSMN